MNFTIAELALVVALFLLVNLCAALWRAARGPTPADRMLAALKLCVTEGAPDSNRTRAEAAHNVARAAIAQALRASHGNRARTARQLGMSRAALYDRLARWPDLDHAS